MRDAQRRHVPIHASIGEERSRIGVQISYRIIELFSDGLYSSPTKAVEELVTNAFDAGAENVHVVVSPDLRDAHSTIAVIDDGTGMDEEGFRDHWIIGNSRKRSGEFKRPKGRAQIGKFGIGKLATYVLSRRLSHVTKVGGQYFAASMDYSLIPDDNKLFGQQDVEVPFRELTEVQAVEALAQWSLDSAAGYKAIPLFGAGAPKSWTVTVMSDLKPMAAELKLGRLRWVLSTAMPIRPDFNAFLNGKRIQPAKLNDERFGEWRLGRGDMAALPKPAPDDLESFEDSSQEKKSVHRFGLIEKSVGPMTGRVELFEDVLTSGKAERLGRSHGFFVYVRGRLINADDEYFGIDSNRLKHGTFSRLRCEVHVDRLDDELRSNREAVRQTSLLEIVQNVLLGIFNVVRSAHERKEEAQAPGVRAARRLAASPSSLTRRPISSAIRSALEGNSNPQYLRIPRGLDEAKIAAFLRRVDELEESPEGFVRDIALVESSPSDVLAIFDATTEKLEINLFHPFVAYFSDEYSDIKRNVPLQLLAISEVLLELRLYEIQRPEEEIRETMEYRDLLLRHLAKSLGRRNALVVSQDLLDAATNKDRLEEELVAAFDSLGFNAVPVGGSGRPDGYAEAHLSGTEDLETRAFKVSLEAKSTEKPGKTVAAGTVGIATIVRHRDDYGCQHAIVVGPDFPTSNGSESAIVKEITADREKTGRTITLVRISDLARLVRNAPSRRIGLDKIRKMFETCTTPEEVCEWVDRILKEQIEQPPYRAILEAIEHEQRDVRDRAINYTHVESRLRHHNNIRLTEAELKDLCKALSRMAPEFVSAEERTVAITTKPKKIIESIGAMIRDLPLEDQRDLEGS